MGDTLNFYSIGYDAGLKGVEYNRNQIMAQNEYFVAGFKQGRSDRKMNRIIDWCALVLVALLSLYIGYYYV